MAKENRSHQLEGQQRLFTLQEVAEYLGKTDRTVRGYIASGKLKATKIGQWRITEDALKEFTGQK